MSQRPAAAKQADLTDIEMSSLNLHRTTMPIELLLNELIVWSAFGSSRWLPLLGP